MSPTAARLLGQPVPTPSLEESRKHNVATLRDALKMNDAQSIKVAVRSVLRSMDPDGGPKPPGAGADPKKKGKADAPKTGTQEEPEEDDEGPETEGEEDETPGADHAHEEDED